MDISTYDPVKISEAGSSNGDVIPHNPDDSDAIDDVDVEIEEITRSKMSKCTGQVGRCIVYGFQYKNFALLC